MENLVFCSTTAKVKKDKVFHYTEGEAISKKIGCKAIIYDQYSHAVYDEIPDVKEKIREFLLQN